MVFAMIFSVSAVAAQASEGLNNQIKNCASLLPKGKKYQVSIVYDIDTTGKKTSVAGNLSVNWSPGYLPSKEEEEKAFKELEPFMNCVGPYIAGESQKQK